MSPRDLIAAALMTAIVACPAAPAPAQAQPSAPGRGAGHSSATYDGVQRSSFYITMRDGVRLAADLYRPAKAGVVAGERLPVVWQHTPYNRRPPGKPLSDDLRDLVLHGYNVAIVDFRGLYASFGGNRGFNRGEWLEPARFDAYDVTQWLAAQPWSSGAIGMFGCSGPGGGQMQAATTRPPALKAIIPLSAEFDAYSVWVMGGISPAKPQPPNVVPDDSQAAPVDGPDGGALMAEAIRQHAGNINTPGLTPFRDSRSPTIPDAVWWMQSSPSTYLAALKASGIGVYAMANWDEAGTRHGAFLTFANLPKGTVKLAVGSGQHCRWDTAFADSGFRVGVEQRRFYDYWLKGVRNGIMDEDPVAYYTYNLPENKGWRTAAGWPPASTATTFYLDGRGLRTDRPAGAAKADVAVSPPVVSRSTSSGVPRGGAVYDTAPLAHDTEVTGDPVVRLWISRQATDADIYARLEDVAPDGAVVSYEMAGRMRASGRALAQPPYDNRGLPWHSHRQADAKPLVPGRAAEVDFPLLPMAYVFKSGHRIRLRLGFTDPQETDTTTPVSVYTGGARASSIQLPVVARR